MATSQTTVVERWLGTCCYCGPGAPLRLLDAGVRRTVADLVRGAHPHRYRVQCRACGNGPRITVPVEAQRPVPAGLIPSPRQPERVSAYAG